MTISLKLYINKNKPENNLLISLNDKETLRLRKFIKQK